MSHKPIQRVNNRRQPERFEQASDHPHPRQLGQKRDASTDITSDRCAVTQDKPPGEGPLFFSNGGEQTTSFWILKGEERQSLSAVENGDDTRRPTAESSISPVEERRA